MAPKVRDWTARFLFGGPRSTSKLIGVCIHTTENDPSTPAENVANYQINSQSGSYHTLADRQGILRENTADWITWSTGNQGNTLLMHLSFVARASMTRAQWLAEDAMLRNGAWEVAQWCKKFGWPVRHVDVAGLPGITTHNATRVWGSTDHTDPGPNFPWDVFLSYVNQEVNGGATPAPTPTPEEDNTVMALLTGVSATALDIVRRGVTTLVTPLQSIINPKKSYLITDLVRFIDATAWENRVYLRELLREQGKNPDTIRDEAIKRDRGEA